MSKKKEVEEVQDEEVEAEEAEAAAKSSDPGQEPVQRTLNRLGLGNSYS